MKDFVILICARGKSKGIKKKNLKKINDISLVGHSIKIAKKIKNSSKIILSTDSDLIKKEALKYGAEVPFMRPTYLSGDKTPEVNVWKHALDFLQNKENIYPNFIVILPPTSPLRSKIDVEKCINLFLRKKYDLVVTGSDSNRSPYFNMLENKKGKLSLIKKGKVFRRQDAPQTYDLTTVCYVISTKYLKKLKNLLEGKIGLINIPKIRSIDIDDEIDLFIARKLFKLRNKIEK